MQFGLTPRRWLILNAAGVGQFQPGVGAPATTPGTTQDKRTTLKGFAARGTLSGFDGLILCHPQGCRCAPNPGLKLAHAFGVKNPGLKLANAFGVKNPGLKLANAFGVKNPGLKLANAFGVKNPGLKLANAFGVNSNASLPSASRGQN